MKVEQRYLTLQNHEERNVAKSSLKVKHDEQSGKWHEDGEASSGTESVWPMHEDFLLSPTPYTVTWSLHMGLEAHEPGSFAIAYQIRNAKN